jgi:hypothetical protein
MASSFTAYLRCSPAGFHWPRDGSGLYSNVTCLITQLTNVLHFFLIALTKRANSNYIACAGYKNCSQSIRNTRNFFVLPYLYATHVNIHTTYYVI